MTVIILSTSASVKAVSKDFVHAASAFGATRTQGLTRVLLPPFTHSILPGIHVALGIASASSPSQLRNCWSPILSLRIAVIAIVAFTLEWLARFIERRFVPWADTSRRR